MRQLIILCQLESWSKQCEEGDTMDASFIAPPSSTNPFTTIFIGSGIWLESMQSFLLFNVFQDVLTKNATLLLYILLYLSVFTLICNISLSLSRLLVRLAVLNPWKLTLHTQLHVANANRLKIKLIAVDGWKDERTNERKNGRTNCDTGTSSWEEECEQSSSGSNETHGWQMTDRNFL